MAVPSKPPLEEAEWAAITTLRPGEAYWVSGVKKSGSNRHWAGSGHILVEESAVNELLSLTGEKSLDKSLYRVTPDLPVTDPQQFVERFNEEL